MDRPDHINGTDVLDHPDMRETLNGLGHSSDAEKALQIAALQQREMGVVRLEALRAMRAKPNR